MRAHAREFREGHREGLQGFAGERHDGAGVRGARREQRLGAGLREVEGAPRLAAHGGEAAVQHQMEQVLLHVWGSLACLRRACATVVYDRTTQTRKKLQS